MKIDEKSCKDIPIYRIEYMMLKYLCYLTINSTNPFYLVIDKIWVD